MHSVRSDDADAAHRVAPRRPPPRLVVTAAGSGSGKTLITLALAALLRDRGLRVRAFKAGPDYIDARLYAAVLGEPARNLDAWLDGIAGVRAHVTTGGADVDVVLVEGMMGLYDGDDNGFTSTATIAQALDAAVVDVLDGWSASQTLAAVALGIRHYDPGLRFAGAILNRAGGIAHERSVRDACARHGIAVLATLPYKPEFVFPERHLGLDVTAASANLGAVDAAAALLAAQLDIDALLAAAVPNAATNDASPPTLEDRHSPHGARPRIAIADDAAFWFTYPETRDALRSAGADLVAFSPLHDRALPRPLDALWIGGGYPEHVAAELEANAALRAEILAAVDDGVPVYGECGGFMYLGQRLHTAAGTYAMCGALPGATSMVQPALQIGYRDARAAVATPFDCAGDPVRAYEFHYAAADATPRAPAYTCGEHRDGAVRNKAVGSFFHRHFIPGDASIERFVAAAKGNS